MEYYNNKDVLIGKTITGIQLALDKYAIKFLCLDVEIIAKVDADCCSETWIESIETPVNGFPAKVSDIDCLVSPDTEDEDGSLTQFYGLKIVTDKGDIIIDYRNTSNGYYGGSLCFPPYEGYYGGVDEQVVGDLEAWKDIQGDGNEIAPKA
jgi:hypothetical protein